MGEGRLISPNFEEYVVALLEHSFESKSVLCDVRATDVIYA